MFAQSGAPPLPASVNPMTEESNNHAYIPLIRDMPKGERPRERLIQHGPSALSVTELVAILLRTGVTGENVLSMSNRLLSYFGGLAGDTIGGVADGARENGQQDGQRNLVGLGLVRAPIADLCEQKGVSEAKACQLLAAFELGRRAVSIGPIDRPIINNPRDVLNILGADMGFRDQEHLRVLLLSMKSEVTGIHEIYKGTVNAAHVRVAEVLRPAVRENCPSIIVVHNHPSGDPTPSGPDILITRQIGQAAQMMDIELLDHIIIAGQDCFSMKNKGLGFGS